MMATSSYSNDKPLELSMVRSKYVQVVSLIELLLQSGWILIGMPTSEVVQTEVNQPT